MWVYHLFSLCVCVCARLHACNLHVKGANYSGNLEAPSRLQMENNTHKMEVENHIQCKGVFRSYDMG